MKNLLKWSLLVVGLILLWWIWYWYYNNVYYYTETINYYNGQIKEQTKYKNWIKNWLYISYYENWQIEKKGIYKDWKETWERIFNGENGENYMKWNYKDWKKEWKWVWGDLNKPWRIENFSDWIYEWERISYYSDWKIRQKWNYKNWKPEWEWVYYYENWKIETISNYENWELIWNVKEYSSNWEPEMEIEFKDWVEIWYSPDWEIENVIVHNNWENSVVWVNNNSDIVDEKMRTNTVKSDIDTNNYELSDSDRKILEESKKTLDKYNYTTYDKDFKFDDGNGYPFPKDLTNTEEIIDYYENVKNNLANLIGFINVENPTNGVWSASNERILEVSKKYIQLIDEIIKDTKKWDLEKCYLGHMVLKNTILDWYKAKDGGCHNESCKMVSWTEDALMNYYNNLQKN